MVDLDSAGDAGARLGRAVAATRWSSLPAAARQQARDVFLDCLAVIAAGAAVREHRDWIASAAGEAGDCTAIGRVGGTTLLSAALVNGGATTRLQWQEGHRLARGHPASHLVPALLALAERRGADADTLMSAFVGGYEAAVRIGLALDGLRAPLHDAGTWPVPGTAAGCAHLLGADAQGIAAAIECAASSGVLPWREAARGGASAHHLAVGHGAVAALVAAQAAAGGLRAQPGTLQTFFGPQYGARFSAASLADGIGADDRWSRLELHAAYLKWHPVCAHFSGVADAMQSLLQQASRRAGRPLAREHVRAVEVALSRAALDYDAGFPCTELAARFSVAAIVHASFDPAGLTDAAFAATAAAATPQCDWLQRVTVLHDPLLDAGYPAGRPTRLTLVLDDGSTLSASVLQPYGDAGHPLTTADRRHKLLAALGRYYLPAAASAVIAAFDAFLDGAPIGVLSAALRVPPAQRP